MAEQNLEQSERLLDTQVSLSLNEADKTDSREDIIRAQQNNADLLLLDDTLLTGIHLVASSLANTNINLIVAETILAELNRIVINSEQTGVEWLDSDQDEDEANDEFVTGYKTPSPKQKGKNNKNLKVKSNQNQSRPVKNPERNYNRDQKQFPFIRNFIQFANQNLNLLLNSGVLTGANKLVANSFFNPSHLSEIGNQNPNELFNIGKQIVKVFLKSHNFSEIDTANQNEIIELGKEIVNALLSSNNMQEFLISVGKILLNHKKLLGLATYISNLLTTSVIDLKIEETFLDNIIIDDFKIKLDNPKLSDHDKLLFLINDPQIKTLSEAIKDIVDGFVVALQKEKKEKVEEKKKTDEKEAEKIKKCLACILELCNVDDPLRTYLVNMTFNQQYISDFTFPNFINVKYLLDLFDKNFNTLKTLHDNQLVKQQGHSDSVYNRQGTA